MHARHVFVSVRLCGGLINDRQSIVNRQQSPKPQGVVQDEASWPTTHVCSAAEHRQVVAVEKDDVGTCYLQVVSAVSCRDIQSSRGSK